MEHAEQEPISSPGPLDEGWYGRFKELNSVGAVEYLEGKAEDRQIERGKFEAEEIENPNLQYPKLNIDVLRKNEEGLLALKKDIVTHPTEGLPNQDKMELVKQVYRWRLNEKIAVVRMLEAAANKDTRRFQRYSEFIYGKPSPEVFAYSVAKLRGDLDGYLQSSNVDLQQAAMELDKALPANMSAPQIASLPSVETVESARAKTMEDLGHLINVPEGQGEIDAAVIQDAFQLALTNLRADGWKVVIDRDKASIAVNHDQKLVKVPAARRLDIVFHILFCHTLPLFASK